MADGNGTTATVDRHRNFDLAVDGDKSPVTFTLGGRTFRCLPDLPGIYLMEFYAGGEATALERGLALIYGALTPEDEQEFRTYIHSKEVIVPTKTLVDLAVWLLGEYAGRPTEPSSA